MALLDIITSHGQAPVLTMERGDIGTVLDMVSRVSEFLTPRLGVGQVFPSPDDVEVGVDFGPSGADYTGNLVQPAEIDVVTGVQYGANGTEFTGDAPAGGGGFISIINE